jgi:hypothetical protein
MSPLRTLTANDFRRQPRGRYLFDRWLAVPPLDTPLGRFKVDIRHEPDAVLVAAGNELAEFLVTNSASVLAAAHRHYLAYCDDEWWMEGCDVPIGLSANDIVPYLNDPTVAVDRRGNGTISGVIYFSPQWDTEHGLYLKVVDGSVVPTTP